MTDEDAMRLAEAIIVSNGGKIPMALDLSRYVRERLTPVEVKKNTTDFRTGLWLCGSCENNVRAFESTEENKFCPECGRPLKWPATPA